MADVFLTLLNRSIAAGWLILAVLILRKLFFKLPKSLTLWLWAAVGLRLGCPATLKSVLSRVPRAETVKLDAVQYGAAGEPVIDSGISFIDRSLNPLFDRAAAQTGESVNPLFVWAAVAGVIWLAGFCGILLAGGIRCLQLKRRLREAVPMGNGVFLCDGVGAPFVFGLFRPKIYLPGGLGEEETELIFAHERIHLKRGDPIWKLAAYLLLAVYWFHPLIWAAYVCFDRDLELACDEKAVKEMDLSRRKAYSQALVSCSQGRKTILVCPLAFGEVGVRQRIRSVLSFKKPARWAVCAAAVICAVTAFCFLTDPAPASSAALELTPETAEETIHSILETLTLEANGQVHLTFPKNIPVSEDGKTRLFLTLTAVYSPEPGISEVEKLLDHEEIRTGARSIGCTLSQEKGTLLKITLRAAYQTELEGNAWRDYAADYTELIQPFAYGVVSGGRTAEAAVRTEEGDFSLSLRGETSLLLELPLPEGITLTEGEELFLLQKGGETVGSLTFLPFAADDPEVLSAVDPKTEQIPMQVFGMAMTNHAGYEDYRVVHSSKTGAVALAAYLWQDLSGSESAAAVPYQEMDCILCYDTMSAKVFAEILLEPGTLTAAELEALAKGIRLS